MFSRILKASRYMVLRPGACGTQTPPCRACFWPLALRLLGRETLPRSASSSLWLRPLGTETPHRGTGIQTVLGLRPLGPETPHRGVSETVLVPVSSNIPAGGSDRTQGGAAHVL